MIVWSAVSDTATDAHDHLDGRRFNGVEAVIGAFAAVHASRGAQYAATFVADALTEWDALIDPNLRWTA